MREEYKKQMKLPDWAQKTIDKVLHLTPNKQALLDKVTSLHKYERMLQLQDN